MLDEAAIKFTNTFYNNIFTGTPICTAFENAKSAVSGHIRETEANLFIMLLKEHLEEPLDTGYPSRNKNCHNYDECYSIEAVCEGKW